MGYQGKQRPARDEFDLSDEDFDELGQPDSTDEDVDVGTSGQSRNSRR
jgi:hypothetical protein